MRAFTLIYSIALCQAVGLLGARWTAPEIAGWYRGLRKPAFNPPGWIFGPVWTTLYLLMGVANWMVIQAAESPWRWPALIAFLVQLGLNLLWPWMFFRRHALGGALVEIAVLWVAIGVTTVGFAAIRPAAAWLMAPYWAWVTFASVLNAAIFRLNPAAVRS